MTTSLMENNQTIARVEELAAKMLKNTGVRAKRLEPGGNSRVFLLETAEKPLKHVMKFYFRHPDDPRDRLETEFSGLTFLKQQGIPNIPHPVVTNPQESCAIYGFIEGNKILSEDIKMEDIKYAADFLMRLKKLNSAARTSNIAPASDACFSISAIIAGIEKRLARLVKINGQDQEYEQLASFLQEDFKPLLGNVTSWAQKQCAAKNISFDREISWEERTLSPSDFGFHNALRQHDGGIVFLDFEYFGWDDPAKMIGDFLLHPARDLSEPMKKDFLVRTLEAFAENKKLGQRVNIVHPLLALKWCMIILNVFVPVDLARRTYASGNLLDKSRVRKEQLVKAKDLCRKTKETYMR